MQNTLRNICTDMISDELLCEYSFSGQAGKKKFNSYFRITNLVISATHEANPESTIADIRYYFIKYIKCAHLRFRNNGANGAQP